MGFRRREATVRGCFSDFRFSFGDDGFISAEAERKETSAISAGQTHGGYDCLL